MITEITMEDLQRGDIFRVLEDVVSVIMFFGPTCGPCKATMPHYENICQFFYNRTDKIKMYRINAWAPEEQKSYCETIWGVKGVPTFKIMFQDKLIHTRTGGGDDVALKEMVVTAIDSVFKDYGAII